MHFHVIKIKHTNNIIGGVLSVMGIVIENEINDPSSNPGSCVSLYANALRRGMDTPVLSPAIGK